MDSGHRLWIWNHTFPEMGAHMTQKELLEDLIHILQILRDAYILQNEPDKEHMITMFNTAINRAIAMRGKCD